MLAVGLLHEDCLCLTAGAIHHRAAGQDGGSLSGDSKPAARVSRVAADHPRARHLQHRPRADVHGAAPAAVGARIHVDKRGRAVGKGAAIEDGCPEKHVEPASA
eukprot:2517001-Pleurochrysis_carterae.AAC.1